jgi:hypothetical protein
MCLLFSGSGFLNSAQSYLSRRSKSAVAPIVTTLRLRLRWVEELLGSGLLPSARYSVLRRECEEFQRELNAFLLWESDGPGWFEYNWRLEEYVPVEKRWRAKGEEFGRWWAGIRGMCLRMGVRLGEGWGGERGGVGRC